jgi:hypothetical protein
MNFWNLSPGLYHLKREDGWRKRSAELLEIFNLPVGAGAD